ncbi:MAG: acyl-CoA thioester hydrolase [Deltaproteobacteria bacterium]|nr:MAG: acyl-CoA thioester hydrolase [Deltaproteobacteria bacterium]
MSSYKIYYEDTDCGGVVYHANYLKYCERARSEIFFSRKLSPVQDGAHFVVVSADCKFIQSAQLGDEISVKTRLLTLKNASLELEQSVIKNEQIIFTAKIKLAFVKNLRPQKIPQDLQAFLKEL